MPVPTAPATSGGKERAREPESRLAGIARPGSDPGRGRRPALDGIRALAVVAVAVYHFGDGAISWLPGGFIGVDIFFVLSGYLITGLLLSEYERRGRISLVNFWVRRARRLVPALVVMLLAVIAFIWWATPPEGYPQRRQDVFWTVGYLANWHFLESVDNYFAAYSTASPLRHTWSLAVEEQFYLLWPLLVAVLLWLGHRLRARPFLPVALAALAGLVFSAWSMASAYTLAAPSRAYYSTQGRVQELFAGVLLAVAFAAHRSRVRGTRLHWTTRWGFRPSLLAGTVTALVVLTAALLTLSDTGPIYYRGGALVISLAAVALIASVELRPQSAVARGLSWRPAVALGRISYGVYLWHWPVTVAIPVQNLPLGEQVWKQAARVVLTLLLATASFWLVEQPVLRDRRFLRSPVRVLGAVVVSMALVASTAVSATALPAGWAYQLTVTSARACPGESATHLIGCLAPSGSGTAQPPSFMLLGDSTARALGKGLDTWAAANGTTWYQAAWNRCSATGVMLIPNGRTEPDPATTSCAQQAPAQITAALAAYRPRTVIIHELQPASLTMIHDGELAAPGTAQHTQWLVEAYQRLIDQVAQYGGHAVFVEMPPSGLSIAPLVAGNRKAGQNANPHGAASAYAPGFNDVLRQAVASRPGAATLISLTDVICPDGTCPAVIGSTIVRNDGVHYSIEFAQKLAPILLARAGITPVGPAGS